VRNNDRSLQAIDIARPAAYNPLRLRTTGVRPRTWPRFPAHGLPSAWPWPA